MEVYQFEDSNHHLTFYPDIIYCIIVRTISQEVFVMAKIVRRDRIIFYRTFVLLALAVLFILSNSEGGELMIRTLRDNNSVWLRNLPQAVLRKTK